MTTTNGDDTVTILEHDVPLTLTTSGGDDMIEVANRFEVVTGVISAGGNDEVVVGVGGSVEFPNDELLDRLTLLDSTSLAALGGYFDLGTLEIDAGILDIRDQAGNIGSIVGTSSTISGVSGLFPITRLTTLITAGYSGGSSLWDGTEAGSITSSLADTTSFGIGSANAFTVAPDGTWMNGREVDAFDGLFRLTRYGDAISTAP